MDTNGLNASVYGIKPKPFYHGTTEHELTITPDGVNLFFKVNSANMQARVSADTARKIRDFIDEWLGNE